MSEPSILERPENPREHIGANLPPLDEWYREQNALLPAYLKSESAETLKRVDELMAAFDRLPVEITTQEQANNYTQLIGFITACVKSAESKREDMTAGPLQAQRMMMSHFVESVYTKIGFPKTDKQQSWGGAKQIATDRLTIWDREVARLERARREEAERIAREAAAELERLAQIERDRVAKEAALAAEAQRLAEAAIANEKDLARAVAMEAEQKDRAAAREAEAKAAAERAWQAQADAAKAADLAAAKSSSLAHSVGAYGAKSSLRETWKAKIIDRDKIDLNKIGAFFSADEILKAANAYAKKNKDTAPVAGLEFWNDERSQVRG